VRLVLAIGLVLAGSQLARAEPCRGQDAAGSFVTCFDPGDRFTIDAVAQGDDQGASGVGRFSSFGVAIHLRHRVLTDDPTVSWRFEHRLADARWDGELLSGTLYDARYQRHSRDGHVVLPTSPPRSIFLPVDFGATLTLGTAAWRPEDATLALGLVRGTAVIELSRSDDFRRRWTVGPRARWDLQLDRGDQPATVQLVAPFTEGEMVLRLESEDGLTVLDLRAHGGAVWRTSDGWGGTFGAAIELERVLVSVNDQPLSLITRASWGTDDGRGGPDEPAGFRWAAGLRLGLGAAR
jgi:hypothetical protein